MKILHQLLNLTRQDFNASSPVAATGPISPHVRQRMNHSTARVSGA